MNRRELLREMSRVQATWVNRNTPGTGDVDIAVEDEQDYLTRIAAVFERAREDVRRKRGRSITAAAPAVAARAAIDALLLAYNPKQPRDPDGKWGDGMPGASGLSRKADPLGLSRRIRLGSGETLRGSDRVRTNSGGDGDSLLAALSGPDGPQVRFAVLPSADAGSWTAGDKGSTARFEGGEDVGRVASGLASVADEAKRARENIRAAGTQLEREGAWDVSDADPTSDQAIRRTAYESLGDDTTITSGVIAASGWGDVHWSIQGSNIGDPGEEEVLVSVAVRPQGERDMPWDEMRDSVTGSWFPALYDVTGAARLARSAQKIADAARSAVTAAAFRFNPGQKRDPDGKWGDGIAGPAAIVPGGDKLKLSGRVKLEPGERLVASAKAKQSGESEMAMPIAVIDTPSGPQVRLGVDSGHDEGPELDDEGEEVPGTAMAKGWSSNDPNTTVRLDRAGLDALSAAIARENAAAKVRQRKIVAHWARMEELEGNPDPAAQAELAELEATDPFHGIDDTIGSGMIVGLPGGGDLAYQVRGQDMGDGSWEFTWAVRPPDAGGSDWSFDEATEDSFLAGIMSPKQAENYHKQIASMMQSSSGGVVTAAAARAAVATALLSVTDPDEWRTIGGNDVGA